MKQIILAAALAAAPLAASAQDQTSEGLSLMERGALMVLEGLMDDVEPAMQDMATALRDLGPQLQSLIQEHGPELRALVDEMGTDLAQIFDQIDDITNYQAPEFLPNGDIILRRKPDAPAFDPDAVIDL